MIRVYKSHKPWEGAEKKELEHRSSTCYLWSWIRDLLLRNQETQQFRWSEAKPGQETGFIV